MHILLLFCSDCQYYLLSSDSELTIERGDKVLVTDKSNKHRWKGTVDQNEDWFPSWVFDSKLKPSVRDSQQLPIAASADDEAARSDLTISKHELQAFQVADSSSLQASCYQHEPSANTQQSSSIETATGEAENVCVFRFNRQCCLSLGKWRFGWLA